MAQYGSFESGNFAASGTETELDHEYAAAPMEAWTQSCGGMGDFVLDPQGAWVHDPAKAQSGNRFVRLESNTLVISNGDNTNTVHYNSGGLMMRLGTLTDGSTEPGITYGPALLPNQTYQLSFWIRDFGINSTSPSIYVYFFDHMIPGSAYTEDRVPTRFRAPDSFGNAIPYDPEDPSAQWMEHIFTFNSTDGNGTLGIGLHAPFSFDENLTSQTIYLDNFQLTAIPAPVPEPAGSLFIGLSFLALFCRRGRPAVL